MAINDPRTEHSSSFASQNPPMSSTASTGQSLTTGASRTQDVTDRLADQAQSTFEHTRRRVTQQMRSLSDAVQKATDQLRENDQTGLARRSEWVSDEVRKATEYVRQKSPREMKEDLERLARQRPAWFLSGAFALGLLAARFLKSTEREQLSGGQLTRGAGMGLGTGQPEVAYGSD